jgi:hypothetical protein
MHSPQDKRAIGHPDEPEGTIQDTLDAFEDDGPGSDGPPSDVEAGVTPSEQSQDDGERPSRQASIDTFAAPTGPEPSAPERAPGSRAMEGIALEMRMESVAMREAAQGILRDELVITVARECEVPLERLDLVDGYLRDLELEGKLRTVGDVLVLAREGVEELLSLDLTTDEFLELYRRGQSGRGGGGAL